MSDTDNPDTDQLCAEVKPVGTPFDGTGVTCGSGVGLTGSPATASVTITGLSGGTAYHWRAQTKDVSAATSSWVSYGSNSESTADITVDTAAPATATVYDGPNVGVDAGFNNGSLSALSANWDAFTDSGAGVVNYQYSIGTTAGATDILNWTDNDAIAAATAGSLTLQTGQMYFVNVRAVDGAGNTSSVASSNGQLVAPTLTFTMGSTNLNLGHLSVADSYTGTVSTTMTTSTNAYAGYDIQAYENGSFTSGGGATIGNFGGGTYAAPDAWQPGDTGFGYTTDDTSVNGSNRYQAATCPGGSTLAAPGCYAPFAGSGPGDVVADNTSTVTGTPITNEQWHLYLRATVPATQPAGSYSNNVVLSVVPRY